jgi:Zn-dependent protease
MMRWEITLLMLPGLIAGITFHEFAHAWSASLLGDDFARRQGRVSLNPFRHLTPLGTLAILFLPIGWGKPVLVNLYNFRRPRRDYLLTSLAGPLANVLLALVCLGLMQWTRHSLLYDGWTRAGMLVAHQFLALAVLLNAIMAVINLLPIPPLDGSKIWPCVLPHLKPAFTPKINLIFFVVLLVLMFSRSLQPITNYTLQVVAQCVPQLDTTPFFDLCTAGNQAIKDKQWKKAEQCYTEALRIDPQSAECYYSRSIALLQQSKADDALQDIDRAIRIRDDKRFALQRSYVLGARGGAKDRAAGSNGKRLPEGSSAAPGLDAKVPSGNE